MVKKISLLLFISSINLFSQQFSYDYSIGKFKDASSLSISPSGFIYITDSGSDEVYKIDTLGKSLKNIGGYGWDEELFDNPVDVYATDLSVYVCDKNNHRIQRFDKDLNFISSLSTRDSNNPDEQFGYPLSCAASNQGDLYILDSENNRIIKFDLFGKFIQNFGGYDAGEYILSDPEKLAITSSNNIFVLDKEEIIVFDQYGNGMLKIGTEDRLNDINVMFNFLTLTADSSIYLTNLKTSKQLLNKVGFINKEDNSIFISSIYFNAKLYVLAKNEIQVFKQLK